MNFTKVIFRLIKRKLISNVVSELLFRVVNREYWDIVLYWCVEITTFCIVRFEEVARGLDDVSKNRLKCADVPGIRLPFNHNLFK